MVECAAGTVCVCVRPGMSEGDDIHSLTVIGKSYSGDECPWCCSLMIIMIIRG